MLIYLVCSESNWFGLVSEKTTTHPPPVLTDVNTGGGCGGGDSYMSDKRKQFSSEDEVLFHTDAPFTPAVNL